MMNVCLDATVFDCPEPENGPAAVTEYVNNLLAIEDLTKQNWLIVTISKRTPEVLIETGRYPLFNSICLAINKAGINNIQPQRVNALINSFLRKLPCLETQLGINDILLGKVECQPPHVCQGKNQPFADHIERILSLLCLGCKIHKTTQENNIITTKWFGTSKTDINISCQIIEIDPEQNIEGAILPISLKGRFVTINKLDDLDSSLDPIAVWKDSSNLDGYTRSIIAYAFQRFPEYVASLSKKLSTACGFGGTFFDTANNIGFVEENGKIERLLRSITETISEVNMGDTHWIRKKKGANSPQRTRDKDGAKAWKRDIDHEFHLLYWVTPIFIEFAKVAYHSDNDIPD